MIGSDAVVGSGGLVLEYYLGSKVCAFIHGGKFPTTELEMALENLRLDLSRKLSLPCTTAEHEHSSIGIRLVYVD